MIVRHKLLADLVKLWKNDELVEKIDRLPIELSPRKSKPLGRCCVHKERAVWRYKTFPLMGLDMTDEHDEVTPLSEYARMKGLLLAGILNVRCLIQIIIRTHKQLYFIDYHLSFSCLIFNLSYTNH